MNIIGRKQAQAFKSQLLSGSQNGPCSTPPRWTVLYMDSMDLRNNGLIAWWSAECALTTSINMETPNSKRNLPSIVKMYVCSIIKKNHTVPWFPVDFPFNKSNEIDLFFWRVEISFLLQIASPVTSRFTHILMFWSQGRESTVLLLHPHQLV